MKVLIVIAAMLALATPATASAPARDPRVPGLQRQVHALKAQVATLAATVNSMKGVITQDEDRNTCAWTNQDHLDFVLINSLKQIYGEPAVADTTPSDNGACSRVTTFTPKLVSR